MCYQRCAVFILGMRCLNQALFDITLEPLKIRQAIILIPASCRVPKSGSLEQLSLHRYLAQKRQTSVSRQRCLSIIIIIYPADDPPISRGIIVHTPGHLVTFRTHSSDISIAPWLLKTSVFPHPRILPR